MREVEAEVEEVAEVVTEEEEVVEVEEVAPEAEVATAHAVAAAVPPALAADVQLRVAAGWATWQPPTPVAAAPSGGSAGCASVSFRATA